MSKTTPNDVVPQPVSAPRQRMTIHTERKLPEFPPGSRLAHVQSFVPTGLFHPDRKHMEVVEILDEIKKKTEATVDEIATVLDQSPAWVSKYLGLVGLHPELQEQVTTSHKRGLEFSIARLVARQPLEKQVDIAAQIMRQGYGIRETQKFLGIEPGQKKHVEPSEKNGESLVDVLERVMNLLYPLVGLSPFDLRKEMRALTITDRARVIGMLDDLTTGSAEIKKIVLRV